MHTERQNMMGGPIVKKLLSNLVLVLLVSSLAHSQVARPGGRPIRRPPIDPKLPGKQQPTTEVTYQRACIAVGGQGTVLVSTDDGATWQVRNMGVNATFGGVAHLNKLKFLAVGTHRIHRSADAGASWTQSTFQKLTPDVVQTFKGIATDGSTRVVAVGQFPKPGSGAILDKGMIQYSTDGGATFKIAVPEVNGPLATVAYTQDNRFVAAGGCLLMYSTDGGATWNKAAYTNTNIIYRRPNNTSLPAPIWNIADIVASKNGRVIAVGGGSFNILNMPGVAYYSDDGGLSWNDTNYSEKPLYIKGVATNEQGVWMAVGTNIGQYIRSTDNGVSWTKFTDISTGNLWLGSIIHVDGNKWLAIGAQGMMVATSDNGTTWTTVNTGNQIGTYDIVCAAVK
jgi:photosystem II stability/assembly factor-like uncharacterized protein